MNKQTDYPASRLQLLIYCIVLVGFFIIFIFTLFKPCYELKIGNKIIGYYNNYEDFTNLYESFPKEIMVNNIQIKQFLEEEPIVKKVFIKRKIKNKFNNYEFLNSALIKEYKIYVIKINNKEKIYTETKEIAEKTVKEIEKEVKKSTKITIETIITRDKETIMNDKILKAEKEQIIKDNKKVVTRSNVARVSSNGYYLWPTTSKTITSYFGSRSGEFHRGIDIGVRLNSNVYAAAAGTVITSTYNSSYGYYIKIKHSNGAITLYAHNNKLLVNVGDKVTKGQIISKSGSTGNSTGPHLHFEILINNNLVNPLSYL